MMAMKHARYWVLFISTVCVASAYSADKEEALVPVAGKKGHTAKMTRLLIPDSQSIKLPRTETIQDPEKNNSLNDPQKRIEAIRKAEREYRKKKCCYCAEDTCMCSQCIVGSLVTCCCACPVFCDMLERHNKQAKIDRAQDKAKFDALLAGQRMQ
jgi:hypothetical protein